MAHTGTGRRTELQLNSRSLKVYVEERLCSKFRCTAGENQAELG